MQSRIYFYRKEQHCGEVFGKKRHSIAFFSSLQEQRFCMSVCMDVCEHKGFCSLSCLCGSVCARMWFCDCLSSSRTWQIHFLPCSSLRLPEVLLAFVIRGDSYSLSCAGPDASRRSGTRLMGSPDQSAAAESFIWHRGSSPFLRVYGQTCISFFFLKDPTRLLSQSCKSSLELLSVQRTPKLPFIATS